MPSDLVEIIKRVGTFMLLVVISIVALMILVSIVDRHPRPRSGSGKNDEAGPRKR